MSDGNYFFNGNDLHQVPETHEREMHQKIDVIDGDEFLRTSPDELIDYYIAEYSRRARPSRRRDLD
jgi:hypothetical protein